MKKLVFALLMFAIPISSAEFTDLTPWYHGYNEKYFNNELPQEILITHELHDKRFQAVTIPGAIYHIDMNPAYTKAWNNEQLLLFHEMCHVRQFVTNEYNPENDHDYRWEACMHRLSEQKAFDKLW